MQRAAIVINVHGGSEQQPVFWPFAGFSFGLSVCGDSCRVVTSYETLTGRAIDLGRNAEWRAFVSHSALGVTA